MPSAVPSLIVEKLRGVQNLERALKILEPYGKEEMLGRYRCACRESSIRMVLYCHLCTSGNEAGLTFFRLNLISEVSVTDIIYVFFSLFPVSQS